MPSPPADHPSQPCCDSIDQQLASARAELAALEQAVDELPEIVEAKFRLGVAAVVETNRRLMAQQVLLQRACASLPAPRQQLAWLPRRPVAGVLLASAGVGLIAWAVLRWWPHLPSPSPRQAQPAQQRTAPVAAQSTLVLRAQGTSWVEVQDLRTRQVLFVGLLERGEQRSIRLRQGLRLRSGRPDLLTLQIDAGRVWTFGNAMGIGWRSVLPEGLRTAGA
ncbi:MAG: DUF4115 domain-containing protein [Cyanobacteriota bacterium]|nr:DUF4115 domain-containing protein [Cyanobacteriota bacterium]